MNGGHILLGILLALAIAEIVYTQGCLRTNRRQLAATRRERDRALSKVGVKDNVRLFLPGAAPVTCESCRNDDATFYVCTDCMMVIPDPSDEELERAMRNHPAGKKL